MAKKAFVTGFPGFIATQLIHRLVGKDPEMKFTFLIQEQLRPVAEAALARLDGAHPGLAGRSKLIAGDITRLRLGMSEADYAAEAADTTNVWHLAAIYDLAVPEPIAYRVNVLGTANVLDFCEACKQLERHDYISTCYVSGLRTGLILESELDEGQGFKNHYEATKCRAEIEVRRRMHKLPTCIHRPGIVVGDSRTGETDKYDGPYFMIKLFLRLPPWLPMVNIGEGDVKVSLVPIDFTVDAMAELAFNPAAIGQTVQLADPRPHTAREAVAGILEAMGRRRPLATVPSGLVARALGVRAVRKLVEIPQEAVIYFNHPAEYDTANQRRLLAGTGVECPDLLSILPTLVDYVKSHPDKGFLDGRTF